MANSSQSGNILGYASGTQPGLVSTVAQTFAGNKTLTGLISASGGILNTGLSGTNLTAATTPGSLNVGEYYTVNSSAINLPTGSGTANIATAIPAGAFIVNVGLSAYYTSGAPTLSEVRFYLTGSTLLGNVNSTAYLASAYFPTLATTNSPSFTLGTVYAVGTSAQTITLNFAVGTGSATAYCRTVTTAIRIA